MPRDGYSDIVFNGPFRGLNEKSPSTNLGPEWLKACRNIESLGGNYRVRRGISSLLASTNFADHVNEFISGATITRIIGSTSGKFMLLQECGSASSYSDFYLRAYRSLPPSGSGQTLYIEYPILTTADASSKYGAGAWTWTISPSRATFCDSNNSLLIAMPSDTTTDGVYAYNCVLARFGSASGGLGTATIIDSTTVEIAASSAPHDYTNCYNESPHEIFFTNGSPAGVSRRCCGFNPATRRLTVTPALPFANGTTLSYQIRAHYFRKAGLPEITGLTGIISGYHEGSLTDGATYDWKVCLYDSINGIEGNATEWSSPDAGPFATPALQWRLRWTIPSTYWGHPYTWSDPGGLGYGTVVTSKAGRPTDTFADSVRIYRKRVDPSSETDWRYVDTVPIDNAYNDGAHPTEQTPVGVQSYGYYLDDVADSSRGTSTAPVRHGEPPQSAFVVNHRGLIFYIVPKSRTVWYSEPPDAITGQSGAEYVAGDNFFSLPEGEEITGVASFGDQLIIFERDVAHLVDTSPLPLADPYQAKIPSCPGCVNHWTIAQSIQVGNEGRKLFWLSPQGLACWDGTASRLLSYVLVGTLDELLHPTNQQYGSGVFDPNYGRYILTRYLSDYDAIKGFLVYQLDADSLLTWDYAIDLTGMECKSLIQSWDETDVMRVFIGLTPQYVLSVPYPRFSYLSRPGDEEFGDSSGGTGVPFNMTFHRMTLGYPGRLKNVAEVIATFSDLPPDGAGTLTKFAFTMSALLDGEQTAPSGLDRDIESWVDPYGYLYVGADCYDIAPTFDHLTFVPSGSISAIVGCLGRLASIGINYQLRSLR